MISVDAENQTRDLSVHRRLLYPGERFAEAGIKPETFKTQADDATYLLDHHPAH